jgi:hypothetical protein
MLDLSSWSLSGRSKVSKAKLGYSVVDREVSKKPDGGPAFPYEPGIGRSFSGISIRDWFAGMAMQALIARKTSFAFVPDTNAEDAYRVADAMLAEREK